MTKTNRPEVGSSHHWSVTKKDLQENAPYARWQDGDGDIWMYAGAKFLWKDPYAAAWLSGVSGDYEDFEDQQWTRIQDASDPIKFGGHEVTKITILRQEHMTDKVFFNFADAPKSMPAYTDALSCRFECARGFAEEWLREAFGILPNHPLLEVINA